ncbi:hypothetical protein AAC387_Pa01g0582 [Persea americana]
MKGKRGERGFPDGTSTKMVFEWCRTKERVDFWRAKKNKRRSPCVFRCYCDESSCDRSDRRKRIHVGTDVRVMMQAALSLQRRV